MMTDPEKEFIRGWIEGRVEASAGIKKVELVMEMIAKFVTTQNASKEHADSLLVLLEKMIEANELVEVEYVLPDGMNKIKSFLLPKGTLPWSRHAIVSHPALLKK